MANAYRDHYMAIADRANDPEGWTEDYPVDLPADLPDYDWPDAPDPRVNDIDVQFGWGWMVSCGAIVLGSLIYLALQVA